MRVTRISNVRDAVLKNSRMAMGDSEAVTNCLITSAALPSGDMRFSAVLMSFLRVKRKPCRHLEEPG